MEVSGLTYNAGLMFFFNTVIIKIIFTINILEVIDACISRKILLPFAPVVGIGKRQPGRLDTGLHRSDE